MPAELGKLEANPGGVADMRRQPDAVFIVDLRKEQLAVREARRLAHDAGVRAVAPLDGMTPSQLQGAQLVMILGGS